MKIAKLLSTLTLFLCFSFALTAQTTDVKETQTKKDSTKKETTVVKPRVYIENAPIKEQFDFIMNKSFRWKTYKSVPLVWLQKFESNFVDSLNSIRQDFLGSERLVSERDKTIKSLNLELSETKNALTTIQDSKDSMVLLGIQMSKSTYNLFIWSLVGGLIILTCFFFLLFKRSHLVTKETQVRLDEVREEFDSHRKNALIREQKLARKLQDEVNKNRNLGM
ncbi:hypothetical protein [Ancylomarina sp. 16SWW S1-10-2]|uniref:hypothetical protein n=1 Tax=Ancylomarina sp. 16SWW S1-10-2 TaxID=2499681 RepID=UPI0012ADF5EC|nr:hypothetical protein [Ancylomarina sp. 16SWW S1-10-2]MRT92880.1 hypothetical protein [Ancylomarina sp. 16SWW S1-10-2]